MGERALWPMVVVVGLFFGTLVGLSYSGQDVVAIIAILSVTFNGVASLIGILLYGKVMKVEQNTNGAIDKRDQMLQNLIDRLGTSVPLEAAQSFKDM